MADAHVDHVREHYNKHTKTQTREEALKAREEGVAVPLKRFHNSIKRALINRFASNANRVIDLACGRGGDIRKWFDANIRYVKGIDLSPAEIGEAKLRYRQIKDERYQDHPLTCEFECTDQLGTSELDLAKDGEFDAVTCMFAIHYFFYSEQTLKMFFRNASKALKNRGFFVATCPDGKRVMAELGLQAEVRKPLLHLQRKWEDPKKPQPFGSAYTMHVQDTVVEAHEGFSEGSLEYLVFRNVLAGVAAQFDLFPMNDFWGKDLRGYFEEDSGFVRHFKPSFPGSDKSLEEASRLNQAIVLQKREKPNARHFRLMEAYTQAIEEFKLTHDGGGDAVAGVGPSRKREDEGAGEGPSKKRQRPK
ncbi:unnamed protein product [Pedinophyceae sp. YPF-701]|nr:unnamed protein product [Pedinophyceae sp. YPF-701]